MIPFLRVAVIAALAIVAGACGPSAKEVRKRAACVYDCQRYCDPSDKAWQKICFADCPRQCDEIKDLLGDYS
jgi:hypothetical protein